MYWSDKERVWIPVSRIRSAFGVSSQAVNKWESRHGFPSSQQVQLRGTTRQLYDLSEVFGWCGSNFADLVRLRRQKKRFDMVQKALSWAIQHPSFDNDDLHVEDDAGLGKIE